MRIDRQKKIFSTIVYISGILLLSTSSLADDIMLKTNKKLLGLPVEPQEIYSTGISGFFTPSKSLKIVISDNATTSDYTFPEEIKKWCRNHKIDSEIINYSKWDKKGQAIIAGLYDVLMPLYKNDSGLKVLNGLKKPIKEGYILYVDTERIVILGSDNRGVMYGLCTILDMFEKCGKFPAMVIRDWPSFPIRAAMVAAYKGIEEPDSQYMKLARHRYNMVIRDGNIFYRLDQPSAQAAVKQWMKLCDKYQMIAVPEINLMGHANTILYFSPVCAAAFTALEKTVLPTDRWHTLVCKNIVELPNCPMVVKSCDGKTIYKKNIDYVIKPGEIKYFYKNENAPWEIRRLPSGKISPDLPIIISYAYVAPKSESYCPSEPLVRQIATKAIRETLEFVKPEYIHLGHDEIRVLGLDPRDRARNLSNAELLADDINFFHDYVKKLSPGCKVMIWSDVLALHQHASGLQTQAAIDLIPKDIILCQWRYMPGELDWITANMKYTTKKGFNVVGTVWDKNQDAWEWLKVMRENNRWSGHAQGVILGAWGGVPDPWAALAETGKYAWSNRQPFPPLPNQKKMDISIKTPPLKANRVSRLLPYNETFDELDDNALPDGWQFVYTPNGVSSKRCYGKTGKSFEVSGNRMVGRGARMYLDDTYCYGYLSLEQQVWADSKTAGKAGSLGILIHGPWFSERALLSIDPAGHEISYRGAAGIKRLDPRLNFPFDRWVKVRIITDIAAKTWDCYMDDQRIIKNAPFAVSEPNIAGVMWESATDGKAYNGMWVDNVKIEFSELPFKVDAK